MFCHSALGRKRQCSASDLGPPGGRWEWQSGARSDVYTGPICIEEGVKDRTLAVPLTWEGAGDPGLQSALQGHRCVWGEAPEPAAIQEIRSQSPGWEEARLVRVWRGPEEITDESLMDKKGHSLSFSRQNSQWISFVLKCLQVGVQENILSCAYESKNKNVFLAVFVRMHSVVCTESNAIINKY